MVRARVMVDFEDERIKGLRGRRACPGVCYLYVCGSTAGEHHADPPG